MRRAFPFIALVAPGFAVGGLAAQDVEMLGERHGTRPPASYYELKARDAGAFEFERGIAPRLVLEAQSFFRGGPGAAQLALGPRDGPVTGAFAVPVLLGLYQNSPQLPPFTDALIASSYFGTQSGTISDYYDEVSRGLVDLNGAVQPWQRVSRADTVYTGDESGLFGAPLGGGGAGNFVWELVALQSIDWGAFDNDGPDGSPNSGDDDGFVDVVAVLHPTRGAECGGTGSGGRIWSHRWSLSSAVGQAFTTATPRPGGGFVRVDDYTIQASVDCGDSSLNEIGVFTHELGHAFGLPDLYDTCSDATCPDDGVSHAGAGIWDLMASGSWGCDNASPSTPCHLGAWSKAQLGWVTVVTLAPDTDHGTLVLPGVETSGTVYRVDAGDGSGEYFLIENRQRAGYDQSLLREGVLIWQIDPDWIAARWGTNTVNANVHPGVWIRQADGRDDLTTPGRGRGDAGDPFPGSTGKRAFHAATNPAASSYQGGPTGLTVVDIAEVGDDVSFRLSTRFSTLTVQAVGASSPNGIFSVNGAPVDPPATTFVSAPFVAHTIEAVAGEAVAPGERRPFLRWSDDSAAPRARTIATPLADTTFVAEYGGSQYEFSLAMQGAVAGVAPATVVTTPASADLWFEAGTDVGVEVVTTPGYGFLGWGGDLAGQPNPATLAMSGPRAATADFELLYAVTTTRVDLVATLGVDAQLVAESGTPPYRWSVASGTLPTGVALSPSGRLSGASIDLGDYPVTLRAVDARGLPATGAVTLSVGEPTIPVEQLASPFLLSGPPLTAVQLDFLNRQGNGVAGYDLGDFRAWVLAHPALPMSANFEPVEASKTIVVPMIPDGREDR